MKPISPPRAATAIFGLITSFPGAQGFCGYQKKREYETRELSETRENLIFFRVFRLVRVFRILSWALVQSTTTKTGSIRKNEN
jgi:hypothetical protein